MDISSKILFVIVIYKVDLKSSLTFVSLIESLKILKYESKFDLLVCDNSPVSQVDLTDFENNNLLNFHYIHDTYNPGISLSYNRAVNLAFSKSQRWLLVFDQDTILPINTIDKYINILLEYPNYPIYAPQLFSKNSLLSPCNYYMYRGTHITKIQKGIHTMKNKNILNSGLLIDINAFKAVGGYDENVWLYFSDFVFFNKLKRKYTEFIVIDCCLSHELSSSDYRDLDFAYNRFNQYCSGAKAASDSAGTIYAYLCYALGIGMRSIVMSYRFKRVSFLKSFVKRFF